MSHSTYPSPVGAAIRPATFADIDDILAISKAAGALDQTFTYIIQYAQQYPDDLIRLQRLVNHLLISPKYPDFHVMVAEAPSLEDVTVTKVIAYAIWDVSYRNKRLCGSEYKPQSARDDAVAQIGGVSACRHVNTERRATFLEVKGEASKRLFDDVYGFDNHLELMVLYTHPDYMRRGFGSALVKWGIVLAKEEYLAAISVLASRMGMLLYAHLGFKHLEQLVTQPPGDAEIMTSDLLALELQAYEQQPESNESLRAANGS